MRNNQKEIVKTPESVRYPTVEIGLFFGAFDPPHWGHARTAEYMREQIGLKEVWFVPSAHHRFGKNMSAVPERVKMLKYITQELGGLPEYRVTPLESQFGIEDGKTLRVLQSLGIPAHAPGKRIEESRYAILLGLDNLARFHEWYKADEILSTVPVFFAERPGSNTPAQLPPNMYVVPNFSDNSADLRSSLVRDVVRGQSHAALNEILPTGVHQYIQQTALYQVPQLEGGLR